MPAALPDSTCQGGGNDEEKMTVWMGGRVLQSDDIHVKKRAKKGRMW